MKLLLLFCAFAVYCEAYTDPGVPLSDWETLLGERFCVDSACDPFGTVTSAMLYGLDNCKTQKPDYSQVTGTTAGLIECTGPIQPVFTSTYYSSQGDFSKTCALECLKWNNEHPDGPLCYSFSRDFVKSVSAGGRYYCILYPCSFVYENGYTVGWLTGSGTNAGDRNAWMDLETCFPTPEPTKSPTPPTPRPTLEPTKSPTKRPSTNPTHSPTTKSPTLAPTPQPTFPPGIPTPPPTPPTAHPTNDPTYPPGVPAPDPTPNPTRSPVSAPVTVPTSAPTSAPPTPVPILTITIAVAGGGVLLIAGWVGYKVLTQAAQIRANQVPQRPYGGQYVPPKYGSQPPYSNNAGGSPLLEF